tara:strand:- start:404 stop:766 length:363 start_codon:yes stop_codon:yes gene_type:complete
MINEIKKSYNPFKMWGSYVIVIVILLGIIFLSLTDCGNNSFLQKFYQLFNIGGPECVGGFFTLSLILLLPMIVLAFLFLWIFGDSLASLSLFLSILTYLVVGFLIGWGIHSLIRRYRNRI